MSSKYLNKLSLHSKKLRKYVYFPSSTLTQGRVTLEIWTSSQPNWRQNLAKATQRLL